MRRCTELSKIKTIKVKSVKGIATKEKSIASIALNRQRQKLSLGGEMNSLLNGIVFVIEKMTALLWGDLLRIPLPGGSTLGLSPMVLLLIPAGIYYTIRTKFLPIRMFREMISVLIETPDSKMQGDLSKGKLSGIQTLIVSTATRVGMGNLVGVVAAISGGGAGAVFWMWITALIGSSTAFIEATLAQLHKRKDPL